MKTKRTLVSLAVFLSVFCLSLIIPIPGFSTSNSNTKNSVASPTEYSSSESNTPVVATADNALLFKEHLSNLNEEKEHEPSVSNIAAINDTQIKEILQNIIEDKVSEHAAEDATEAKVQDSTTEILGTGVPEKVASKFANIGISIADSYVNIRKEASTDSDVVGKLYKDAAAEIIESYGDWYFIESGSVKGYVSSEFVKTGMTDEELITSYAKLRIQVNVDGLNVRKEPDTESERITVIYKNEVYPVIDLQDDWLKIDLTDEEETGYISKDYAELLIDFEDAISIEEEQELARLAQEKEQKAQQLAKEKEESQKQKKEEDRIKKETEIKKREETSYTEDDLKLLSCLVHAEAGSQSYEGKLAVANVVLNRVKSSKYPNTIKNVIYQRGQFSVATSGSLKKQLNNYENYRSNSQLLSIKAAKAALEGQNNIGTRLYFNAYKTAIAKGYDSKPNSVKIDDQLFW